MADIKINDIKPAGAELFGDDESFMDEISNNDMSQVFGGGTITVLSYCGKTVDNTWLSYCSGAGIAAPVEAQAAIAVID